MNRLGHRGRVDRQHGEILAGLREAGVVAYSLASVGGGVPDIVAASRGETWLLEVKSASARLTPQEQIFAATWPGRYAVVRSVDDALRVFGVRRCDA